MEEVRSGLDERVRWLRRRRERFVTRMARKTVVSVVGGVVVVVGVILLPLPGPGMLVIALGLAILSSEYRWPARFGRWAKRELRDIARQFSAGRRRTRRPTGHT